MPLTLLAANGGQTRTPGVGGGGLLIMWYICHRRRHNPIGGWLLFYYIQLYLGALFSLLIVAASLEYYSPSSWDDSGLYAISLISSVPQLVLVAAQVAVATALLKVRSWRLVSYLKGVLAALIAFGLLSLALDYGHFPDAVLLDLYSLIWPLIWLPYFSVSKRVRSVFQTKDWEITSGIVQTKAATFGQTPSQGARRWLAPLGRFTAAYILYLGLLLPLVSRGREVLVIVVGIPFAIVVAYVWGQLVAKRRSSAA